MADPTMSIPQRSPTRAGVRCARGLSASSPHLPLSARRSIKRARKGQFGLVRGSLWCSRRAVLSGARLFMDVPCRRGVVPTPSDLHDPSDHCRIRIYSGRPRFLRGRPGRPVWACPLGGGGLSKFGRIPVTTAGRSRPPNPVLSSLPFGDAGTVSRSGVSRRVPGRWLWSRLA